MFYKFCHIDLMYFLKTFFDGEFVYVQKKRDYFIKFLCTCHSAKIIVIIINSYPSCGEGNGTPLQHFCLENPIDGGA